MLPFLGKKLKKNSFINFRNARDSKFSVLVLAGVLCFQFLLSYKLQIFVQDVCK